MKQLFLGAVLGHAGFTLFMHGYTPAYLALLLLAVLGIVVDLCRTDMN